MQIMHFTPPQIAKYFAVNESTIKRWILSGKLKSDQTLGGHYRVSKEQMNEFISKHAKYANSSYVLKRMLAKKKNEKINWQEYYECVCKNDSAKAMEILRTLYLGGKTLSEIFDQIIIPTLRNIGIEWMQGRLEINMEHRMSFQIAQHISVLSDFTPEAKKKNLPEAILACVPGNSHVIPMFMGDAILRQYNFKRQVLGINISIEQLKKTVMQNKNTKLVCLSKTYSPQDTEAYLKKAINLTKKKNIALISTGLGWSKAELALMQNNKINQINSLVGFEDYLKELV